MKKISIIILLFLIALPLCKSNALAQSGDGEAIDVCPFELPRLVIAASLFSFPEDSTSSRKEINTLLDRIKALPGGVSTDFATVDEVFIVQNNLSSNYYGYKPVKETFKELGLPFQDILFVTTPIESLDNKVLVFASIVSPNNIDIISVDSSLSLEVIYNSSQKTERDDKFISSGIPLTGIFAIEVVSPGHFILHERPVQGAALMEEQGFKDILRTFEVDVSDGTFKISQKSGWKSE